MGGYLTFCILYWTHTQNVFHNNFPTNGMKKQIYFLSGFRNKKMILQASYE